MPPIDPISLGTGIADFVGGSIINPILQSHQNKLNREFSREQYATQRKDALTDWANQNAYNSPAAQMARYKAAGLNPKLIYGQSNMSPAVRSSEASSPSQSAPQVHPQLLSAYQDAKMFIPQQQQLQNALELQKANEDLIIAQTMKTIADTNTTEYNLKYKQSMAETYTEIAQKRLEGLQVGNSLSWQKLSQQEKMFPVAMANAIASTQNKEADTRLKAEYGMTQIAMRRKIAQEISMSLTQQSKVELEKMSERQKQILFDDIQQGHILDNLIKSKSLSQKDQELYLNEIKTKFKSMGLSETVTSDLIKAIITAVGISKVGAAAPVTKGLQGLPTYKAPKWQY